MEKGQKPKSNITTESEEVINESGSDLLHFGGISMPCSISCRQQTMYATHNMELCHYNYYSKLISYNQNIETEVLLQLATIYYSNHISSNKACSFYLTEIRTNIERIIAFHFSLNENNTSNILNGNDGVLVTSYW